MLDNIRRKLSHQKHKVFYDKVCNLGMFEDLVYYNDVGYPLPIVRATKKASAKSFRYIYQTSKSVELKGESFEMLTCPAGTFIMGQILYEDDYVDDDDDEDNPPRTEVVDASFLLGQTEVTQALYKAVMGTNPSLFQASNTKARDKSLYPFSLQHPVEDVSWDDAILFCNKLSELQGLDKCYTKKSSQEYDWLCDFGKNGYRLPTEKEWEYAAKAGTQNRWAGTNAGGKIDEYAVFDESPKDSTEPVRSKNPNEWGFYDMSGNVKEWCWDKYTPKGAASALRVNRGGGWSSDVWCIRSDHRGGDLPGSRNVYLGFRVCRTLV